MQANVVVRVKGGEVVQAEIRPAMIDRARNSGERSLGQTDEAVISPWPNESRLPFWTWFIANPRGSGAK